MASSEKPTAAEIVKDIWQAEAIGDYLQAFDQASQGIALYPDDETLRYLAVRALARSGSPWRAESLYRTYRLGKSDDVDVASLEARIAKDQFLLSPSNLAPARRSARLYEKIFERTGDYYPGINAATMWTLSGSPRRSQALAQRVIGLCERESATSAMHQYWLSATLAEAALLLGDLSAAERHLRVARSKARTRYDALASTARQLRLICEKKGLNEALLDLLPVPAVIFFSGHIISPPRVAGRFPARAEPAVAERIARTLDRFKVRFGYGSLAAGADILFAEALLARRAELHIVLPFEAEEFKQVSVAPAGGAWTARFDACLAKAKSVVYATRGAHLGHDVLFGYASKIGMGLARIRSRALGSTPTMVAVWDGMPARGKAGTALDVAYWKDRGFDAEVIPINVPPTAIRARPAPARRENDVPRREILPVLFGDVKGFSGLQEQHLPRFNRGVMAALAKTIHRYGKDILFTNTWGDAVHVVFTDLVVAARCALEMQETLAEIDFTGLDFPGQIGMRISLHIGPVFVGYDPINREETYYGRTLTRAARMEPITPVGEVYVTEQFAALIEMERGDHVQCTYVGNVPLAKDFGNLRMYRLTRLPG